MKNETHNTIIKVIMFGCFLLVTVVFAAVPVHIFVRGLSAIDRSVLGVGGSSLAVFPAVFNTLLLAVCTLLISFPISLFTSLFLWFFEHHIPKTVHILQALIDSLGAVPSIVYALFGLIFFVGQMSLGFSLAAGILTMTIIVLPVLIRSSEQALQAIPREVYLSGVSLGVSKSTVMFSVLLPQAYKGILSGGVLAVGRIVGESAALIFTMGTAGGAVYSLFSSGRTLAVQVYSLASEGLYLEYAYATSVFLLIFVAILNFVTGQLLKK